MTYGYVLSAVILQYRAVVLSLLIAWSVYDARFLTYINYALLTLGIAGFIFSMRQSGYFQAFSLYVLPPVYGLTIYIFFAIVVIVQLNDNVLLRSSKLNGGTRDVGDLHSGDFFLHYSPAFELLLVLLFNFPYIKAAVQPQFRKWSRGQRIGWSLYALLASSAVIVFYMSSFPFLDNYPTGMPTPLLILISVVVAVLIELLLYLGLVLGEHDKSKVGQTPISKWTQLYR